MEFAIPILAIGGWYASCENKPPPKHKEDFSNRSTNDECGISSYTKPSCGQPCQDKTTGANHFYGNTIKTDPNTQFESLTGNYMHTDKIQHNNMTPFFGSKTRGNAFLNDQSSDSTLDTMQGKGSEMIKKQEQAPLFKPQENMQWTHGMPNQGDFMRSRMNAPNSMNNVKPWQEVQVGPGINQGYDNNNGSGGFNSGMEHRDLYLPKNVNELRTTTNPKIT
jgi:hypothetical protein